MGEPTNINEEVGDKAEESNTVYSEKPELVIDTEKSEDIEDDDEEEFGDPQIIESDSPLEFKNDTDDEDKSQRSNNELYQSTMSLTKRKTWRVKKD